MSAGSRFSMGLCVGLLLLTVGTVPAQENHALTFDGEDHFVTVERSSVFARGEKIA